MEISPIACSGSVAPSGGAGAGVASVVAVSVVVAVGPKRGGALTPAAGESTIVVVTAGVVTVVVAGATLARPDPQPARVTRQATARAALFMC
jgi:hypothetical protein